MIDPSRGKRILSSAFIIAKLLTFAAIAIGNIARAVEFCDILVSRKGADAQRGKCQSRPSSATRSVCPCKCSNRVSLKTHQKFALTALCQSPRSWYPASLGMAFPGFDALGQPVTRAPLPLRAALFQWLSSRRFPCLWRSNAQTPSGNAKRQCAPLKRAFAFPPIFAGSSPEALQTWLVRHLWQRSRADEQPKKGP